MPNVLNITFTSNPVANDELNILVNILGSSYTRGEMFLAVRDDPNETAIGATANITAQNYADALLLDYPNEFSIIVSGNQVSIFSIGGHNLTANIVGDFATVETEELIIAVSGLEYDRYLINNEIWIRLGTGTITPYYDISFYNNYNQQTTQARVYANSNGQARVNISPYIKSLFELPSDAPNYIFPTQVIPNAEKVKITVSVVDLGEQEIEKTFVRGGNRTNNTNQSLPISETLRPTLKLPTWAGYETADYVFDEDSNIVRLILSEVDASKKDPQRRRKGCNEVYIEFLNQKGGYCHWLFNSHERSETGGSEGTFVSNNEVEDLGGKADNKIKVFGKFPEYYKGYIADLVISPEVHIWQNSAWTRVTLAKNTTVYDNVQRAYNVVINIEYQYRFNPSILWSN